MDCFCDLCNCDYCLLLSNCNIWMLLLSHSEFTCWSACSWRQCLFVWLLSTEVCSCAVTTPLPCILCVCCFSLSYRSGVRSWTRVKMKWRKVGRERLMPPLTLRLSPSWSRSCVASRTKFVALRLYIIQCYLTLSSCVGRLLCVNHLKPILDSHVNVLFTRSLSPFPVFHHHTDNILNDQTRWWIALNVYY